MSIKDFREKILDALDLGWPLRGCVGSGQYIEKGKLDDKSTLLEADFLDATIHNFPSLTNFAVIPTFLDDFICLDFDFEDAELNERCWSALDEEFKREDLFLRIGKRTRLGQLWFKYYPEDKPVPPEGLELKRGESRLNAIGQYKAESDLNYEWPYKKIWEYGPEDLPILMPDVLDKLIKVVAATNGYKSKDQSYQKNKSRHLQLGDLAAELLKKNYGVQQAVHYMINSDVARDIIATDDKRNVLKECIDWVVRESALHAKNYIHLSVKEKEDYDVTNLAPPHAPTVEEGSFFDIFYRAIRRNQFIDNKQMAMATTLSVCGWLGSLIGSYEGVSPNLMLLILAPSGTGKSTSTKAIDELVNLIPELGVSRNKGSIRSEQVLLSDFDRCAVNYYEVDEATQLFKDMSKNVLKQNIPESLSQIYSDFNDRVRPSVLSRYKTENYGVVIDPRINLLCTSTPSFWNYFSEEHYRQGLGRRMFPIIINEFSKTRFVNEENYFNKFEKGFLLNFFDAIFAESVNEKLLIQEVINIDKYEIFKNFNKKNGQPIYHSECKRSLNRFRLKSSSEVAEYMSGDWILEMNEYRRASHFHGSSIEQVIMNSRPHTVKKFAFIHAVFGKKIFDENGFSVPTHIEMESIKWAKDMFDYYMLGAFVEVINRRFEKEKETESENEVADVVYGKMLESGKDMFKKSDNAIKNVFRGSYKDVDRNKTLLKMEELGLVIIHGDINSNKCEIEIIKE
jgi:hypothetical protein